MKCPFGSPGCDYSEERGHAAGADLCPETWRLFMLGRDRKALTYAEESAAWWTNEAQRIREKIAAREEKP